MFMEQMIDYPTVGDEFQNEMEEIIGQVSWLCPPEEKYFTEVDAFLNTIQEELPYFNTSGFRYKVLTDDPEVRQAANRIVLEFFDMVDLD